MNNEGYVNLYMRSDPGDTNYYDCRLDFLIPNPSVFTSGEPIRELVIDHTTTATSSTAGCGGSNSIGQYLAANTNAVLGVGNGEGYAFTLNTGSTNQNNFGLKVCSVFCYSQEKLFA